MATDLETLQQLAKEIGIYQIPIVSFSKAAKVTLYPCCAIDIYLNVIVLNLDRCNLNFIPSSISKFKHLLHLNIWDNKLIHLSPDIPKLNNLIHLGLGKNRIDLFPEEIYKLKRLKSLHLNNNRISQFPKEITKLKNLQYLRLDENKIKLLPKEISKLGLVIKWEDDGKGGIILIGNPLESPSIEIVKKGINELICMR